MLTWRRAGRKDLPLLAELNRRLIVDERAPTSRDLGFLKRRMGRWLSGVFRAVLFHRHGEVVAYAIYRRTEKGSYIRQLYVDRPFRRTGVGRAAVRVLVRDILPMRGSVNVDCFLHNKRGMAFWHAAGFKDWVMRMRMRKDG